VLVVRRDGTILEKQSGLVFGEQSFVKRAIGCGRMKRRIGGDMSNEQRRPEVGDLAPEFIVEVREVGIE
jgi:hypothetical protein